MHAHDPFRFALYFSTLRDTRVRNRCDHRLLDVVIMALCAVIGNCNDWQQIALFARERRDWFARFLPLPNGTPSHDTFERVFERISPEAFQKCFRDWVRAVTASLDIPHIAIDGKTLRGSGDRPARLGALHLVSAWATEAHLSLGQVAVDTKSNEITAIPKLLELLELKGAVVTIDAIGCQKEIARQIVDRGGEYLLAVKGNQGNLHSDIQSSLEKAMDGEAGIDYQIHTTEETHHGRKEKRLYVVMKKLEGIRDRELWKDLSVIGMCVCEREVDGVAKPEARYFISSEDISAEDLGKLTRHHWRIENNLHWQLDVTFREDANQVAARRGAENLALLRRLALSLLKHEGSKQSMACKRLQACMSTTYLEKVLVSVDKLGKD